MSDPLWEVFALNPQRERVAQIDGYQKFDLTPRFNGAGGWVLQVVASGLGGVTRGWALEFVRNGTTVMSGPVRRIEQELSRDRTIATISGVDWLQLLAERLIYPSPSPFTASAFDSQTDPAETLLHHYVDAQIGAGAESPRRIANLTFATDEGRGETLSAAGRFQNLLVEMAQVARVGGDLGFRLDKDGTSLVFSVYEPADRSASVVFSRETGNLISYAHVIEAPSTTYAIVGGDGEGTTRTFLEGGSADLSTWGRIETFVDKSSADTDVLRAARDDELSTSGERTHLSVETVDTESISYLTDYNLGDIVTVVAGDSTVVDVVREVSVVVDRNGENVRPKIRTPGDRDPTDPAIYGRVSNLERRLLNLEAN